MLALAPPDNTPGVGGRRESGLGESESGGESAFLGRALLELCKKDVRVCDPIAAGVELLYQRLDALDDVAAMRLANVFAAHLNNTKFRWPYWRRWAGSLPSTDAAMTEKSSSSGGGGGGGGGGDDDDDDDEEDDMDKEVRFLAHALRTVVALNHSSPRFRQLLASLEADLPPAIEALLPPDDVLSVGAAPPATVGGFGGVLGGVHLSADLFRFVRDAVDKVRTSFDGAQRRFLVATEQRTAANAAAAVASGVGGGAAAPAAAVTMPPSQAAREMEEFVESYPEVALAEAGAAGRHWRLYGLVHALLSVGAATDVELTLTLQNTQTVVDFHADLLRRLLRHGGADPAVTERAHFAFLDALAAVWGRSPPHLSTLVVTFACRGLLRPDLVLAWMGERGGESDGAGGGSNGVQRPHHPLALRSLADSHAPLTLACDMVAAAAPFAWASDGGVVVVKGSGSGDAMDDLDGMAVSSSSSSSSSSMGLPEPPLPPEAPELGTFTDVTVEPKEFLARCVVAALGPLAAMAGEAAGGGGDDGSGLGRAARCAARAVVRQCLAQRGVDGRTMLLDAPAMEGILEQLVGAPADFTAAVEPLRTFAAQ